MSTDLVPSLFGLEDAFNGFSVDDLDAAEAFYRDTLGIPVDRTYGAMDLLQLRLGARSVLVYPKGPAHAPASYTVLNFPSDDVHATVRELTERGLSFLRYDGMPHDELGVMTGGGPLIAWFTDPAGNVHSVIQRDD
ncbi:VOC family protein [Serinicoccus kebangsaanensis]|uniref:VOC family protein n=1 Tax=Serinicoccus kebangsaanensis TaxID=2602069 RepID=UPI00124EF03E|nr:VOC family protein [Serinicoccus kebangsaanensis]